MTTLTRPESVTLQTCERIIQAGQETFVEVGAALLKIRDDKLYRAEFKTFDEYCRTRWHWSRIHAHRMIAASAVASNLLPTGNTPESERQARPLAKLPPVQQQAAWQRAQETATANDRPVTARDVQAAVIETVATVDPLETAKPIRESKISQNLHCLNLYWRRASKDDKRTFVKKNQPQIRRLLRDEK